MLDQSDDRHQSRQPQRVTGNEPLLLNDPGTVWLLKSGSMALFAVAVVNGLPEGARRYLFSVTAGEALFGAVLNPPEQTYQGILAVAIAETELVLLSLKDLGKLAVSNSLQHPTHSAVEPLSVISRQDEPSNEPCITQTDAVRLLEGWINHLSAGLAAIPTSAVTIQTGGDRRLTLTDPQTLQASPGTVIWVQIQQGRARWLGLNDLIVDCTSGMLPLGTGAWLAAIGSVDVVTTTTAELEDFETLGSGLSQLHAIALRCYGILQQQQAEDSARRFQQQQRLNRQVTEAALDNFASLLQPQRTGILPEGDPLLVAAGAVGRALGIPICPPARSEELNRVKDPLEAIARASRIRIRRVLLTDHWWRKDNGPLLGYTLEGDRPIALLPVSATRYELFDPVQRTRRPVDAHLADQLSPEASMFHRPLANQVKRAVDLVQFGVKGHERDVLIIGLVGIAASLLGMVVPQATAILIDQAIPDSDRGLIWQLGLALFAVAFGKTAFELTQGLLTLRVETAADGALQPAVWDKLLDLKPSWFRQYSSGDIQSRVMAVSQIRRRLSGATQRTLLSGVFALLNLGLMFVYSWQLAIIASGIAIAAIALTAVSSVLILRKTKPLQELSGTILGLTVQLINGVAKLRVAAAEERAFAYWGNQYSQQKRLKSASQRIDDAVSVFNEVLPTVSSILFFWFAIQLIQPAQGVTGLTAGTFLAFNAAFGIFIQGATSLSNTLTDILEIVPLWERAQSIITAQPEADSHQADPGRLTGRLSLEHVTFRYREDGPLILDDVSLQAEPGEFIAVVGPSGSGKSTIFRLLLGFEAPAAGTVSYDGQDLAGLDIQAVRRQLGVVLQNGRINTGSIFELITGGALVSMDEAWEAARNAGFADDIQQMAMGIHTVISEGGTNLSGGQRQRLLIARSLVLKPKIILMDEATSALDNRTQTIVTESLARMNATRVVIAHRLSTIQNADRIYVVEAGRVAQVGTFAELINQDGLFARLAARQLE